MSQISSINFKKSFGINAEHNDRTLAPSYLIDNEKGAECNRTAREARRLKEQITRKAIQNYTNRTKQKFQAKSYEWSAVVNIKPETTMQDLENLAKHFNETYGFQCYQIAIHRDEGHIDENSVKQINHHAHLEFITLDKDTGKNKQRDLTPKILRQIQDEVAEILKMNRGVDKRISKIQRVEPRKYAQMKEQEKAKIQKIKKEIEEEKKENTTTILSKKAVLEIIKTRMNEYGKDTNINKNLLKLFKEVKKSKKDDDLLIEEYIKNIIKDIVEDNKEEFYEYTSDWKIESTEDFFTQLEEYTEDCNDEIADLQSRIENEQEEIKNQNAILKSKIEELENQNQTLQDDSNNWTNFSNLKAQYEIQLPDELEQNLDIENDFKNIKKSINNSQENITKLSENALNNSETGWVKFSKLTSFVTSMYNKFKSIIAQKDKIITQQENTIAEQNVTIANQSKEISNFNNLKANLADREQRLTNSIFEIAYLKDEMKKLEKQIVDKDIAIQAKDELFAQILGSKPKKEIKETTQESKKEDTIKKATYNPRQK